MYYMHIQKLNTLIEQSLSLIEQPDKSTYSNKTVGSLNLGALVAWFFFFMVQKHTGYFQSVIFKRQLAEDSRTGLKCQLTCKGPCV